MENAAFWLEGTVRRWCIRCEFAVTASTDPALVVRLQQRLICEPQPHFRFWHYLGMWSDEVCFCGGNGHAALAGRGLSLTQLRHEQGPFLAAHQHRC
jgi:hypothetical protein